MRSCPANCTCPVSRLTYILRTASAPFASGDSVFSVIEMTFTFFLLQMSSIGRSSPVLPPLEAKTITSPSLRKPVAPWTASAGEMNRDGRSMQQSRCEKCWQAIPECPQPEVPMRSAVESIPTAFENCSSSKTPQALAGTLPRFRTPLLRYSREVFFIL